jgi:purine-binding chemotaxis protein CheW
MEAKTAAKATQYLTFSLGKESFAIEISKVREVLEYTSITKVPQTPEFMRGVINLRGGVVPVVDLRLKFGMSETTRTINTCIIIVEVDLDGEQTVLGALADSVREVISLGPDQVQPAPRIGTQISARFLKGMGKKDDEFIIILDIDKIFSEEEIMAVSAAEGQVAGEPGAGA